MNHDFEDIEVKSNAPELLEMALKKKRKKCMIGTGAMCDPYMHIENKLQLTRQCLEIIDKYGFGVAIQTKSNTILRDLDLLLSIHKKSKCVVQMTLTTYDEELCKIIEPAVSTTKERFEVLKIMRDHGIPTVVWLDPILPFLNDTEENIIGLLDYCVEAKVYGIICFGMGLTLRSGNRQYFYQELGKHFPNLPGKYHNKYGYAYEVTSDRHYELMNLCHRTCREHNIVSDYKEVFKYLHTYKEGQEYKQISLF